MNGTPPGSSTLACDFTSGERPGSAGSRSGTSWSAPAISIDPARAVPIVAAFQEQFGADWVPADGKQAR